MATIFASTPTSSITRANFVHKSSSGITTSRNLDLPAMAMKRGSVRCCMDEQQSRSNKGMSASLIASICGVTMSSPALALVDERLSTEGTGLPFGLSNNLLGWILLGVFGLIWSFYTVYTSTLDDDEDSGLSL
ncbi:photosystem II reaction center W protein, chloroplastic [Ricinus communis]|uniref:PSII 6.1 kDa protein n=1 Tax=Ricinus communis TaxID=3988 RepID=B9S4T1_RICCO|nr:photosystem II reaction center W protein, chloroplastic [Ricinus communis]EEF41405.1 Photosystem II reaction center W protein, chloroplast precursor, putative [Ricinus communis]|eukprot:XP_002520988.1 photosystem II reaction center W protein, chloroplastic [Ricinus communis]